MQWILQSTKHTQNQQKYRRGDTDDSCRIYTSNHPMQETFARFCCTALQVPCAEDHARVHGSKQCMHGIPQKQVTSSNLLQQSLVITSQFQLPHTPSPPEYRRYRIPTLHSCHGAADAMAKFQTTQVPDATVLLYQYNICTARAARSIHSSLHAAAAASPKLFSCRVLWSFATRLACAAASCKIHNPPLVQLL